MENFLYKTLKKLEKYTKTDMVYLTKGGFWLISGQIISTILAVAFSVVVAKYLSKESFGMYKYALSIIGIISSFYLSGLGTAITRATALGIEGVLKKAIKTNFKWGVIPILIYISVSAYYFVSGNSTFGISFLIAAALSPFVESFELYSAYLNGKKDFKLASLLMTFKTFFSLLLIALSGIYFGSAYVMIGAYFVSNFISNIAFYFLSIKIYKPNEKTDDGESVSLGKHNSVVYTLASFSDQLDNILIFHYLGAAELAIYNFAVMIPNTIQGLIKNLAILAVPKFAAQDIKKAQKSILGKTFVLFIFTIPIVILYYFLAPLVYKYLFPNYQESVKYTLIYIFSVLINSTVSLSFFDANYAIREKYKLGLSSNILKCILLFAGAFYWGIWGVILARFISKLFGFIYSIILARGFIKA